MIYKPLENYSDDEIMKILYHGNDLELERISLIVGEYHENYYFAQDLCFFLLDNENEKIRVNALLGLSYLARRFKEIDSNKAIEILKKHRKFTGNSFGVAECAIDDIKLFTGVDMSDVL